MLAHRSTRGMYFRIVTFRDLIKQPIVSLEFTALSCLVRGFSNISLRETTKASGVVPLKLISNRPEPVKGTTRITFLPREISLDIGHAHINPLLPRKEIIDIPLISRIIENPNQSRISEIGDLWRPVPVVDLPTGSNKVDDSGIQAARLIVIRRRKMRKHKLKKLRKKMKYDWAKVCNAWICLRFRVWSSFLLL